METAVRKTRKQHIYAEAAKLFGDKGYRATSMRDLAESVGLEPSSLYSHIKSKEELLRKICIDCGQRFLDGLESIQRKRLPADQQIRALIQLHVRIAHQDNTAITVFNDEWRHLTEPDLSGFLEMRRQYEDGCLRIIEQGMHKGQFVKADPGLVLSTLLSAVQWVYRKQQITAQEVSHIADEISELFLNGLKNNP